MSNSNPIQAKRIEIAAETAARLQGQDWQTIEPSERRRYITALTTILGAVDAYDHKRRGEWVMKGHAKARKARKDSGLPPWQTGGIPPLADEIAAQIRDLLKKGETYTSIRAKTGVGNSVITRIKSQQRGDPDVSSCGATDPHGEPGAVQIQREAAG